MLETGDRVTWESQAGGSYATKTGVIYRVIPAHVPVRVSDFSEFRCMFGSGRRNHESYIIKLRPTEKSAPVLYWPRVSWLRRA